MGSRSAVFSRLTAVALWALTFVLWVATARWGYLSGLLFVLLGSSALLLTTVAAGELRTGPWRSGRVCEVAGRAAWTTGALGTVVLFESVLLRPSHGLGDTAARMAWSFLPSVFGGAMAIGLLALASRAATQHAVEPLNPSLEEATSSPEDLPGSAWDRWTGRLLFVLVVGWPLVQAYAAAAEAQLGRPVGVFHWPAVLVLTGIVAAIRLIGGKQVRSFASSAALASAGTLSVLVGVVFAVMGMAAHTIETLATGLSFALTACFVTLLGLTLATLPLDDRWLTRSRNHGAVWAARCAWLLFPLVTIALLALTFVMILTPMQRQL